MLVVSVISVHLLHAKGESEERFKDFSNKELAKTNYYRSLHSVQPLKLSDELNKKAEQWAQQMADTLGSF